MTDDFLHDNEEISRVIEIKGSQTLKSLHKIIFRAFDREDEHITFTKEVDRRVVYYLPFARVTWDSVNDPGCFISQVNENVAIMACDPDKNRLFRAFLKPLCPSSCPKQLNTIEWPWDSSNPKAI